MTRSSSSSCSPWSRPAPSTDEDSRATRGIRIEVVRKDIKNVHLSVHPPADASASLPATSERGCHPGVRDREAGLGPPAAGAPSRAGARDPREFLDRESHFVWGRRLLLRVVEVDAAARADLSPRCLTLRVAKDARAETRPAPRRVVSAQIRAALAPLLAKWCPHARGGTARVRATHEDQVGSCNPRAGTIRLNTELARKPPECLEYLVVHELAHLLEPTHNLRFRALMERFMPAWQSVRQTLNRLPFVTRTGVLITHAATAAGHLLFSRWRTSTRRAVEEAVARARGYDWAALVSKDGDALEAQYRKTLEHLGRQNGLLGLVFRKAQNKIADPAKLRQLVRT